MSPNPFNRPLNTERLAIDRPALTDAAAMHAYHDLQEVRRFQDWEPASVADAESRIAARLGVEFDSVGKWYQLAVREQQTALIIGDIGVHVLDEDRKQVEVGITIDPNQQGKGIATEALAAVIGVLFEVANKHRIVGSVDPGNVASCRLMERLGFQREGHFRQSVFSNGKWFDDIRYGMLLADWHTARALLPED